MSCRFSVLACLRLIFLNIPAIKTLVVVHIAGVVKNVPEISAEAARRFQLE
jgi:hypothetical protein